MTFGGSCPSLTRKKQQESSPRFVDHDEVGADVRQSVEWTTGVLQDPVSSERAKSFFDTFVDPAEIGRVFDLWRDALPGRDL